MTERYETGRPARRTGRVIGGIGLGLVALSAAVALAAPDPVAAARAVIRLTARSSLGLFLLAFSASALAQLAPGAPSRWLCRHRRAIGLSFALSHLIHAMAFLSLWRLDPALFAQLTNPVTFIGGGLAYLAIAAMAVTSTDRAVAWLGARRWRGLHLLCGWYLVLSFALNFGKRIPLGWPYGLATALIVLAVALRGLSAIVAARRRRRADALAAGG